MMDAIEFKRRVSSPRPSPVNTGKVLIGVAYVPRQRWDHSSDAYEIQTLLLAPEGPRKGLLRRFWERYMT